MNTRSLAGESWAATSCALLAEREFFLPFEGASGAYRGRSSQVVFLSLMAGSGHTQRLCVDMRTLRLFGAVSKSDTSGIQGAVVGVDGVWTGNNVAASG